jgi:hypothetical protein
MAKTLLYGFRNALEGIMFFRCLAGLALLGFTVSAADAADRPVVVELFTSQGCSSCPPANAYLNQLARDRTDVLPLAFHVTYWDRLGWKDPFSIEEATSRQDRYGHRFGDGSYTPEIVVDGATSHVGSNRADVSAAIEAAKRQAATAAHVSVTKDGGTLAVDVGAGEGRGSLLLIGFDHNHTTAIRRGENGGRTLEEANVVRSVRSIGDWQGSALRLHEKPPEGEDVAVVLEAPDGRIVGAAKLN